METFSALLAICAGNSPVPGEFPTQRPVTRSFDVYFDLRPNKCLSKQSWGWWFETLSCSLWRHRNEVVKNLIANFVPKLGQTASHPDGHQNVFPNNLWPWGDHWYFFNSIQVKFYIEVNIHQMEIETPKHICLENHVHIQWAESQDPIWEVVLWSGREPSCGDSRTFMRWYIVDNSKMIVQPE